MCIRDSFTDMGRLGDFFKNLVGANGNIFIDQVTQTSFMNNLFLIIAAVVFCLPVVPKLREFVEKETASLAVTGTATVVCNISCLLVSSIMLVNATNNPFLYFRF